MSLDREAIQHIQDSASIPELMNQLDSDIPLALVPESMQVQSLEKYMEHASRYRLEFHTTSIEDFNEYNTLHDADGATCFVDADSMEAESIYDLGTPDLPGHKQNKAKLHLNKTAAFNALLSHTDKRISQKQAGEFIEDWDLMMTIFTKPGDNMIPNHAARALQNLTIEAARSITSGVDDFGANMTSMEKIEAKDKDKLPSEIKFKCVPYNGLQIREFIIRVSLITGEDKPVINFRVLRLESHKEEMAEEFKQIISDAADDLQLKTFIGQV